MQHRLIGFLVLLLGGASWTPVGREFVKALFWDRVMHFTLPILSPIAAVAADYGIPMGIVALGLYFLVGREKLTALHDRIHRSVNYYLLGASLAGLICAVFVVGYFLDRARGPIIWSWGPNAPLQMTNNGSVFGVNAFQFNGYNRSKKPITNITTFVRSNKTARVVPLMFSTNGPPQPAEKIIIPAEEKFTVFSVLPQSGNMISFEEFKNEFGKFTFHFDYEGGSFERDFGESETDHLIDTEYRRLKDSRDAAELRERQHTPGVVVKN